MTGPIVELDGLDLIGRDRFHTTFASEFGFLDGYGRNMDAWIDCMGYLRDPPGGMTAIHLPPGETLTIRLRNHEALRDRAPQQWRDLMECAAFVNFREIERGDAPALAFAF